MRTSDVLSVPGWARLLLGLAGALMGLNLLWVSAPANAAPASDYEVVVHRAQAFDRETGALVYSQVHAYVEQNGRPLSAEVRYFDAMGALYATKTLDFAGNAYAPFFETRDVKNDYREAFKPAGDGAGKLLSIAKGGDEQCGKVFPRDPSMVIDAGFNSYLADHRDALRQGDTLDFTLYLAKACRGIDFEAKLDKAVDGKLIVTVRPERRLYRLFVPETVATYDAATGNLIEYVGLSDLNNAEGKNLDVRITFDEPERRPVSEARAEQLQSRLGDL